jgi:PPK2 family polyphosphate:nucleotide phosphotransferase
MTDDGRGQERLGDRLVVRPGSTVDLGAIEPADTLGWTKAAARDAVDADLARLTDLQERLWAERKHKLLIVLQGLDGSGKGGTIEHVMGALSPLGCTVHSFKVPTEIERAHDFLWRIHLRTPGTGEIAIFDRSHYEDVLVVRVEGLAPEERWRARYDQINAFEGLLAADGTTIRKFYLHIGRDEQRERLQARVDDPRKQWKFRMGDLATRARWDEYQAAYREALERCSTDAAPWYVIPADRKWFRNLAVARILAETLEHLDPQFPPPEEPIPEGLVVE